MQSKSVAEECLSTQLSRQNVGFVHFSKPPMCLLCMFHMYNININTLHAVCHNNQNTCIGVDFPCLSCQEEQGMVEVTQQGKISSKQEITERPLFETATEYF